MGTTTTHPFSRVFGIQSFTNNNNTVWRSAIFLENQISSIDNWLHFISQRGEIPLGIYGILKDEGTHHPVLSHSTSYRYLGPILPIFRGKTFSYFVRLSNGEQNNRSEKNAKKNSIVIDHETYTKN